MTRTAQVLVQHRVHIRTAFHCVCVVLQLWTAQPPLAEWIRRGQPAHTPPQRPPGAERKGRHKGRKKISKPDCTGEGRRKLFCTACMVAHAQGWWRHNFSRLKADVADIPNVIIARGTAGCNARPGLAQLDGPPGPRYQQQRLRSLWATSNAGRPTWNPNLVELSCAATSQGYKIPLFEGVETVGSFHPSARGYHLNIAYLFHSRHLSDLLASVRPSTEACTNVVTFHDQGSRHSRRRRMHGENSHLLTHAEMFRVDQYRPCLKGWGDNVAKRL
eukprot:358859-Chlamydomonas_euryale.AAC.18